MSSNPLFPNNPVRPEPAKSAAVELIRAKVARAYSEEPSANQELTEIQTEKVISKHQQFLQELARSGKSLADIQVAWHHYYTVLPDKEKHEVWEEFYAASEHTPYQKLFQKQQPVASRIRIETPDQTTDVIPIQATTDKVAIRTTDSGVTIGDYSTPSTAHVIHQRITARRKHTQEKTGQLVRGTEVGQRILGSKKTAKALTIKQRIQFKMSAGGKLRAKHHIQSLLFGLSTGAIVVVILLFSFFNEYFIAPFIQPSDHIGNIPVIASDITTAQAAQATVIVPSINIQIPIDFSIQTTDETAIENSLNNGVVHYASTVMPGQNGNTAFFGHSSRNIFNNGKYKFAFVELHLVKTGDLFYITYQGKVFVYQVFDREIVPPNDIGVLSDTKGEQATAVLITCDPPGFSINRLVVWGKQISPSPDLNTVETTPVATQPTQLANNGPTLWNRLWNDIKFWQ